MAFNITAGSGTPISADVHGAAAPPASGQQTQWVGIATGTTGALAPVSSSNPLQVTVATALPAGTAAIGKLAANSGVDIGDVDVTSVIPGTGATNLGKAEDAAHTGGDVGVMALTVRQDVAAALAGTDADYQPLISDASGRLHVNVGNTVVVASHAVTNAGTFAVQVDNTVTVAAHNVTNAGTFAVQAAQSGTWNVGTVTAVTAITNALPAGTNAIGKLSANSGVDIGDVDVTSVIPGTGATNLGKAEDDVHGSGDVGVMALAVRKDTAAALAGADGDYQPLITDVAGRLHVIMSNGLVPGTANTQLGKAEDAVHGSGDTGVFVLAVRSDTAAQTAGADGDYCGLICDSTGKLHVNVGNTITVAAHAVTNAGTFVVQIDGAALTALQLIDNIVLAEDAAHNSGDSGVQALAVRKDAGATIAGTDGDYSPLQVDANGNLRVNVAAGAAAGGTSATDDADFTAASTAGTPVMGVYQTTVDNVTDTDLGIVRITQKRAMHVTLYDSGGTELAVGGGTQYTEDAAAAANPIGNALIVVREDARAGSLTSADGDNVALRGNNKGELYVKHTDSIAVTGAVTVSHDLATWPVQAEQAGTWTVAVGTVGATANDLGKSEDAGHSTGDRGVMALAVRKDTAAALAGTDLDYIPLTTNATGHLWVSCINAGTFAVQVDGAALTALQLIDNVIFADDAGFSPSTSSVAAIGMQADETSTDSVDEGDIGCPRITLDRKQIVADYTHTAGGESNYTFLSTAAVLTAEIKGSAGQVYSLQFFNLNAAARYVRLYNQTGAPGTGDTANIVWRGMIPGNTAGAGFIVHFPKGKAFATGIGIRVTAAIADNDGTALAANEIMGNVGYK